MTLLGPEPRQACFAAAFDDPVGEGATSVIRGLREFETKEFFDESIRIGYFDASTPDRLGDHGITRKQTGSDFVHDDIDIALDGTNERFELR